MPHVGNVIRGLCLLCVFVSDTNTACLSHCRLISLPSLKIIPQDIFSPTYFKWKCSPNIISWMVVCTGVHKTQSMVIWALTQEVLSALLKQIPFVTPSDAKGCFYSRPATVDNTRPVVCHHHSPVWEWYQSPNTLSLLSSSNGTSKHLYLITKPKARAHNKSRKQWGNSPTSDLFPYETPYEELKLSDVAHMNPLFLSPSPKPKPVSFSWI